MTTILRGNIIHAPALGRLETMEKGYLVLEDGVIQGVYRTLPSACRNVSVEDYGEYLILQSFADMHVHAPQYAMIGRPDTRILTTPVGSIGSWRRISLLPEPPEWLCFPPSTQMRP